jgi:UDP-galactopyranose mutase
VETRAEELDASVCGRIPLRTNYDDRYLVENFQALPAAGYSRLFERMVRRSDRIKVVLRTDYREIREHIEFGHLIFTGPIDEYYDHVYGPLPYRSLRFERETYSGEALEARKGISGRPGYWQPTLQVNYPNDGAFTRTVELKHATGQRCEATTVVREFPDDYVPGKVPYYPIPTSASQALYQRYATRAQTENGVSFVGRLATYRYYNMDQIVGAALAEFERLRSLAVGTSVAA